MSIAQFAVSEGAIAQGEAAAVRARTPPKRRYIALADGDAVPEPR